MGGNQAERQHLLEVAVYRSLTIGDVVQVQGGVLEDLAVLRRLGLQVWSPRSGVAGGQLDGQIWWVRWMGTGKAAVGGVYEFKG